MAHNFLSEYISDEEWESIRNDPERRNKAAERYIKLVHRELKSIDKELAKNTMMKDRTRQRKLDIGMTYLAEAILDVIKDEGRRTDGSVSTTRINKVLGFNANWEREMCRSVLVFMAENGEIVDENGGAPGAGMWRIVR